MPNSRHIWVIGSPSRSRATKRRRSSITELAFHGIDTSRPKAESVTHVSGTKCHPCLGPLRRDQARRTALDDRIVRRAPPGSFRRGSPDAAVDEAVLRHFLGRVYVA